MNVIIKNYFFSNHLSVVGFVSYNKMLLKKLISEMNQEYATWVGLNEEPF